MTARRSRPLLLGAAGLCLALTGACTVQNSNPSPTGSYYPTVGPAPGPDKPGQAKFSRDKAVHYDLRTPPTLTDLGVPPGMIDSIFSRGHGDPLWDVTIDLPGGSTFTAKAFGVAVAAPPGPGSAQEWEIVVNSSVHSMAELAAEMRRVQPILHLDKGKVDGYVTSADKGRAGQLVLTGGQFGYVKTSAEPRPTGYADDNIAINYTFHWPAQPGTSAS